MFSGERRGRSVWLWWPCLLLLLITGCAPLSLAPHWLAGGDLEGYEAPGAINYPPPLLEKVAAALKARGRYRRGPVYGIAMQNALRGLQAERELPVSGRIDTATLLALGIDPSLLPGGLPPVTPDALSRVLARMASPADQPGAGRATASVLPAHSPGLLPVRSPLAHFAAPVASLVAGKEPFCTGFLVGPDLLLTAASCFPGRTLAKGTVARFNRQEDGRGRPLPTADYRCTEILEIDARLNYGLVRLADEPGYDWGYLELADELAEAGEELAVIGHPAGTGKRIFEECRAGEAAADGDLGFSCDAGIDMAGAPVISRRSGRVVAIAGRPVLPGKNSRGTGARRLLAACRACEPLRLGGLLGLGKGGDGFFLQQGGRLGLLRSRKAGWESEWLPAAWLDQWQLPGSYQAQGVDMDGKGGGELVLKNSRWLAVFKGEKGEPRLHWTAHDRIGKWQLGNEDRTWAGDFNGDGLGDLLVFDGRRLGLLLANGRKLTGPWLSGPKLGGWRFGRADRFHVGDFNGDGRDDVLARRGSEAAVFLSRGERLELAWDAAGRVGSWELSGQDDHHVGDFTGDGCDEVLARRDGELALWKMEEGKMEVQWRQLHRLGSWRLGWQDRLHVADFTGDGRDDVLIRSNESIGLLVSSGRFFTTPWLRFDRFRGWDLTPFDRELVGDFNRDGKADLLLLGPGGSGRFLSTGAGFVEERGGQGLVLAPAP